MFAAFTTTYTMYFASNTYSLTLQQVYSIISASSSIKSSKKFRAVLEVILAFGNYLNSSKRGPAYGFKLQSLDTLLDTKSNDKRMSLMHYIVATIRQKFPELMNFDTELFCIDKAAQVSLEMLISDVNELEKGMEAVRKEADLRGKGVQSHVLRDFLGNSEEKLKKIKSECKTAQVCVAVVLIYRSTDRNVGLIIFSIRIVGIIQGMHRVFWRIVQKCRCKCFLLATSPFCTSI